MADEEPVDIRHEIWDDVRQNKCQYWNNKYEDCKLRFKTTTDEEASCKAWYNNHIIYYIYIVTYILYN